MILLIYILCYLFIKILLCNGFHVIKALPDNPSNEADMILDNCIQKLLKMKDTECISISNIQSVVLDMMNKLKENRRKNIDPLVEGIDSDDEI